jgi:hypothetical protein
MDLPVLFKMERPYVFYLVPGEHKKIPGISLPGIKVVEKTFS